MEFIYNDGGRSQYFKATNVNDCVCRAICNATDLDYKEVYDLINMMGKLEKTTNHRGNQCSTARDGVFKETLTKIVNSLGCEKIKVQEFGSSIKCHLDDEDLKDYMTGSYIINVSRHETCLRNGKLYDTYNCTRGGDRQVYVMYKVPEDKQVVRKNFNKLVEDTKSKLNKKESNKDKVQHKIELATKKCNKLFNEYNAKYQEYLDIKKQYNKELEKLNKLRRNR